MVLEDSFVVEAPRERVWAFLTDPARIAPCIPGCESIAVAGPDRYQATVRVEVGPIKARFNLEVVVEEQTPPERVLSTTRGEEGTRASVLTARNRLVLRALGESRTEISYSSEVSLVGRLGKFGLGVMKKKAQELGGRFAENVRSAIEAPEPCEAVP
jgi:carbon monoxide dehydrogenase subunit G